MAKQKTSGAISDKDRKFILDNCNKLTPEEIASQIGKSVESVNKVIRTHIELPQAKNSAARWHLKKSTYYKQLRESFTQEELSYIEDQYVKYIEQFDENILATEEMQVLLYIKLEVLMNRNLAGKINIAENVKRYGQIRDGILKAKGYDYALLTIPERSEISAYEDKIAACLQSEKSRTDEYMEIQKQYNSLSDKVMGSRHQRVTELLNQKINFGKIVGELLSREKQLESSRYLQLGHKAVSKEFERLAEPHKYADGIEDNPILCAEVVDKFTLIQQEQEQEQEEKKSEKGETNGAVSEKQD